jgi:hypothetical protein
MYQEYRVEVVPVNPLQAWRKTFIHSIIFALVATIALVIAVAIGFSTYSEALPDDLMAELPSLVSIVVFNVSQVALWFFGMWWMYKAVNELFQHILSGWVMSALLALIFFLLKFAITISFGFFGVFVAIYQYFKARKLAKANVQ